MAYQGSAGNTYETFSNILGISEAVNLSELLQKIITSLNNAEDVTLEIANKIYIANQYKLDPAFSNVVRSHFFAEIENVDFTQNAANKINEWIEVKTNGKIQNVVTENDFDYLTSLVFLNAIYFKSEWMYKFNKSAETSKSDLFFLNEKEFKRVEMMQIKANVGYGENLNLDAKLLELPYKNKKISMVIVLPNKINGIVELQQKLLNFDIDDDVLSNIAVEPVSVKIPKFKIESNIDFKQPLSAVRTLV